ncbi:hypothetical protein DFH06DRAFT_1338687 [Mycena polygramma]|nr:hypothetical protein DFH06DRAFT_1338687 [Mycena polygramma]
MSINDLLIDSNPEPCFPPEIEREIVEIAATRHRELIPALYRVCRRVHAWVEPLRYRVMHLIDNRSDSFFRLAETKSASFWHTAVRHLFLSRPNDLSEPRKNIIRNCTGVINLYFNSVFEIRYFDLLGPICLVKLTLVVPRDASQCRQLLQHPNLRFLTHLDLYESTEGTQTWEDWSALAALPGLTHLCVSRQFPSDVLIHAMAECPRLAVAVTGFWAAWEHKDAMIFARSLATTKADLRMVALLVTSYDGDWRWGARGKVDFWIRAEVFITRKRRGEIDESCYLLQPQ